MSQIYMMHWFGHTLHAAASSSHHHWYHRNKLWEGYDDRVSVLIDKKKTDSIFCMQVFGLDVSFQEKNLFLLNYKVGEKNNCIMILQKQSHKIIIIIILIHLLATCNVYAITHWYFLGQYFCLPFYISLWLQWSTFCF